MLQLARKGFIAQRQIRQFSSAAIAESTRGRKKHSLLAFGLESTTKKRLGMPDLAHSISIVLFHHPNFNLYLSEGPIVVLAGCHLHSSALLDARDVSY